jgi:hypothetical protein
VSSVDKWAVEKFSRGGYAVEMSTQNVPNGEWSISEAWIVNNINKTKSILFSVIVGRVPVDCAEMVRKQIRRECRKHKQKRVFRVDCLHSSVSMAFEQGPHSRWCDITSMVDCEGDKSCLNPTAP